MLNSTKILDAGVSPPQGEEKEKGWKQHLKK
jgi:hypothetical protein